MGFRVVKSRRFYEEKMSICAFLSPLNCSFTLEIIIQIEAVSRNAVISSTLAIHYLNCEERLRIFKLDFPV